MAPTLRPPAAPAAATKKKAAPRKSKTAAATAAATAARRTQSAAGTRARTRAAPVPGGSLSEAHQWLDAAANVAEPTDPNAIRRLNAARQRAKQTMEGFILECRKKGNGNTLATYGPYVRRFKAFCHDTNQPLGERVDVGKVYAFLEHERNRHLDEGNSLSQSTGNVTKSAVMWLWGMQATAGLTPGPSPEDRANIKAYLDSLRTETANLRKVTGSSKRGGSLMDSYVPFDTLEELGDAFLPSQGDRAARLRNSVASAFGHRCTYLLTLGGTLRCKDALALTLSDIYTFDMSAEIKGPSRYELLVLTLQEGKTNQHGNLLRTGILRNRHAHMCSVGAVAVYLFCLWHMLAQEFPDLSDADSWFHRKLVQVVGKAKIKRQPNGGRRNAALHERDPDAEAEYDSEDESREDAALRASAAAWGLWQSSEGLPDGKAATSRRGPVSGVGTATYETPARSALPLKSDAAASDMASTFAVRVREGLTRIEDLPGSQGMSYDGTLAAYRAAFAKVDCDFGRKKTHIGRSAGTAIVLAQGGDAPNLQDQIRRHGHWNHDAMTVHYGDPFPMGAIRTLARFDGAYPPSYFIPRAAVDPPDSLLECVFPGLDRRAAEAAAAGSGAHNDTHHFVAVLKFLRRVFLQDSIYLKERWPHLTALWDLPIFHSHDYKEYAARARARADELVRSENPVDTRIRAVAPDIKAALDSLEIRVVNKVESLAGAIAEENTISRLQARSAERAIQDSLGMVAREYRRSLRAVAQSLLTAASGGGPPAGSDSGDGDGLQPAPSPRAETTGEETQAATAGASATMNTSTSMTLSARTTTTTTTTATATSGAVAAAAAAAAAASAFERAASGVVGHSERDAQHATSSTVSASARAAAEQGATKSCLDRTVTTVPQLHAEWFDASPSVASLVSAFRLGWLANEGEKKHYSRRAHVIARVQRHPEYRHARGVAVQAVEQERQHYSLSLSKMGDLLDNKGEWKRPKLDSLCAQKGIAPHPASVAQ